MAKISRHLQKAIDNLDIQDVYLKSTRAWCHDDFDPKSTESESLLVQKMHVVDSSELFEIDQIESKLLRVYVRLGARWITPGDQGDDPDIKALVEAQFIAEYQSKQMLKQKAIDEFSLKNVSYHVWPYWREYLSSQCERLRLPRVVLPAVQFSQQPDVADNSE